MAVICEPFICLHKQNSSLVVRFLYVLPSTMVFFLIIFSWLVMGINGMPLIGAMADPHSLVRRGEKAIMSRPIGGGKPKSRHKSKHGRRRPTHRRLRMNIPHVIPSSPSGITGELPVHEQIAKHSPIKKHKVSSTSSRPPPGVRMKYVFAQPQYMPGDVIIDKEGQFKHAKSFALAELRSQQRQFKRYAAHMYDKMPLASGTRYGRMGPMSPDIKKAYQFYQEKVNFLDPTGEVVQLTPHQLYRLEQAMAESGWIRAGGTASGGLGKTVASASMAKASSKTGAGSGANASKLRRTGSRSSLTSSGVSGPSGKSQPKGSILRAPTESNTTPLREQEASDGWLKHLPAPLAGLIGGLKYGSEPSMPGKLRVYSPEYRQKTMGPHRLKRPRRIGLTSIRLAADPVTTWAVPLIVTFTPIMALSLVLIRKRIPSDQQPWLPKPEELDKIAKDARNQRLNELGYREATDDEIVPVQDPELEVVKDENATADTRENEEQAVADLSEQLENTISG